MSSNVYPIDIIVPWVDGSDSEWLSEKRKYDTASDKNCGNADIRFRDWDMMRFFFRGIEKNMPWVNKVFFVTWGHLPDFLNTENEKLVIVNHRDFIPEKYLPTFNSNVIELNYHRIKELSENFILFNDDIFVVDKLSPGQFFRNDFPCDMLISNTLVNYDHNSYVWHIAFNNMGLINKYFPGGKNSLKHFSKWINPCYGGRNNIGNLSKMMCRRISGFYDAHFAVPHKKSTYEKIWQLEGDYLDNVCNNRFRSPMDLSHWLMRYWNLASGSFEPTNTKDFCKYYEFGENDEPVLEMCKAIRTKEHSLIVLNDTLPDSLADRFSDYKKMINDSFREILPDKCSYEK